MSGELILLLVLVFLAVLVGLGFYFLSRKLASKTREASAGSNLHGMIGPYADIKRAILRSTPEDYTREEIPLTRENVVMLVYTFEGEVNNGGIDQFFFNSSGDYAQETIQALELIEANKMAEVLRQACQRFPGGDPPTKVIHRRELMLAEVAPDGDTFDDLDEEFYRYEDDLYRLLEKYEKEVQTT